MRLLLSFLIVVLAQLALCAEGRAQTPAPSCPAVRFKYPDLWQPGDHVTISAEVDSSDAYLTANLKYKWAVSAGEIISGQGTQEITIDTMGTAGQSVTATVEIDGLPAGCDRTESCTLPIVCGLPMPRQFDKYGDISDSGERATLTSFADALEGEPGATAYLIVYGEGNSDARLAHLERMKNYLVRVRNVEPDRIVMVDAGRCERLMVQLYLRPPGAPEPVPEPCP